MAISFPSLRLRFSDSLWGQNFLKGRQQNDYLQDTEHRSFDGKISVRA